MSNITTLPVKPVEKLRTITLTGRSPLQIKESEWPIFAEGYEGYEEDGAPICWSVKFKIRKGKWSQYIIYAVYDFYEDDMRSYTQTVRVGRYVTVANTHELWKHLKEVANELRERILYDKMRMRVTLALDACFAKLEPESR